MIESAECAACGDNSASGARTSLFQELFQYLQQIRHGRGGSEFADPAAHPLDIGARMNVKQSFDMAEILWPLGNCLHDQKIFHLR